MLDIILSIEGAILNKTDKISTLMEPTCYWRRKTTNKKTNEFYISGWWKGWQVTGEGLVYPGLQRGHV